MEIKTQYKIWFFAIASLSGFFNAYNAWSHGNTEAAVAWLIAAGSFAGTSGAYQDLKELEDKNSETPE